MSDRRASVTFTFQARLDLQEILLHSLELWGPEQLDRYEAAMDGAIRRIQEFPAIGRECSQLMEGGRWAPSGSHVIYYTCFDRVVTVHRILYERRHVTGRMLTGQDE